jgi:ribosomal protein S18 acetylase RimI-like enzyme
MPAIIIPYKDPAHRDPVIDLWKTVFGYGAAHNAPALVIDKKLAAADGLFFVAVDPKKVIGTVMAGYDGHRGWIYSIAVSPRHRRQGLGSALLSFAEERLSQIGCLKINLQILESNAAVAGFYLASGYQVENRISMGKRLPQNIP